MVVILPLEIPAAAIFHVYPRQPRIVLDVAFHKHFGSRFDGLRYFVTTVCTDLWAIPWFLPYHILLLFPIVSIFLNSCTWRRIMITVIIADIEGLTFDLLGWSDIVSHLILRIRPWDRWVIILLLHLLISLLHQEFFVEGPSIVILIAAVGVQLRRTVTLHHSGVRLSNSFPCWIVQSEDILF
jgi:hypothetical protein